MSYSFVMSILSANVLLFIAVPPRSDRLLHPMGEISLSKRLESNTGHLNRRQHNAIMRLKEM